MESFEQQLLFGQCEADVGKPPDKRPMIQREQHWNPGERKSKCTLSLNIGEVKRLKKGGTSM